MNQTQSIHPSLQALAELQMSDWQQMMEQLSSPTDVRYAEQQIARIQDTLGLSRQFDTHVRTATQPDEAAFPIPEQQAGLTKREYMATALLAGILANKGAYYKAEEVCSHAVTHTDALINALNNN